MIQTPNYYVNMLKELNIRYNIILSEFNTTWPKHKTFPNIAQYSDAINIDEENLEELQSDFFQLKNDLEKNIKKYLQNIKVVDKKINNLDEENNILYKKLQDIKNSDSASKGMVDDIQLTYNQYLLANLILCSGIITFGYLTYKQNS